MTDAAYAGWKNDMLAGKITLMAAADSTDVTGLSARARADRVTAGQVEAARGPAPGREPGRARRLDRHPATTTGGCRCSPAGTGSRTATPGTSSAGIDDGSLRRRGTSATAGCSPCPPPTSTTTSSCCTPATAHRAQGATVDTAHPLITDGHEPRIPLRPGHPRPRAAPPSTSPPTTIPFDDDARVNQVRTDPRQYAAREILLNILGTETAPLSATETITTAQDEAGSLADPRPPLPARRPPGRRRPLPLAPPPVRSANDGGRDLTSDPAWGAVVRRLFDAEGDGWDPARLLATVAAQRELASADSIAEVITWRLDAFLAGHPEPPPPTGGTPNRRNRPRSGTGTGLPALRKRRPGHASA